MMAEIRIPTDQIPLDILHRLQAMIPSLKPPSPQTHAFVNQHQNQFQGYSTQSTKQCSPTFEQSLTAVEPLVKCQTYARSRGSSWASQNKTQPAVSDEVDGDDTIVHAFTIPTPTTKVTDGVMDDSDIVRIFPNAGEGKTTKHNGSDVVRIFESGPDGVKRLADTTGIIRIDQKSAKEEYRETARSDIVRVLSPVPPSQSNIARPNSKSDLTQQCNPTDSRTDSTESQFRITHNSSSWGDVAASQHNRATLPFTGERRHSSSVMPSSVDFSDRRANIPEPRMVGKGSSHNFYTMQTAMSQMSRESVAPNSAMTEQVGSRMHHGYPETCSTAQTVDDAEDDEVFSLEVGSKHPGFDAHKPCLYDTNQHIFETTPIRDLVMPHLNPEGSEPIKNRVSPFSPALMLSEMSFGDRQNTRKRLSFEEGEASPPKSQFKFPPSMAQQSFQGIVFSSAVSSPTNATNSSVANKSLSPFLTSQKQVFTYPYRQCSSPNHELSCGSPTDICQKASEKSSTTTSSCRSPVSEIMQALEQVSSHQVHGSGASRGRVRSDGDEAALEARLQDQGHPLQPRPRGQTFSHSKRRRTDSSYSGDDEDNSFGSQESLTQSRDQAEEACGDCQCSMIKKYVLQVAENAYKRIRKMDGSVEDFERFRTELATTNNLLRESIANIYSFKTICPHKSRSSSSSSSSSFQSSNRPC